MTAPKKKPSAREKLERSKLRQKSVQRELMGDDLDLEKLLIYLKSKIQFDLIDLVTDIQVTRTIEGASTVKVSIIDDNRDVWRSGIIANKLDINLDGLWFRLVKVEKTGNRLDLTFEDREIAILRTYKDHKVAHRSQVTRAGFILNLIREVKDFKPRMAVVIPELHMVQPIQKAKDLPYSTQQVIDLSGGIPEAVADPVEKHRHGEQTSTTSIRPTLKVKGAIIDKEQIRNANTILDVGRSMELRRKLMVCAIMTAIVESVLRNVTHGDEAGPDSVGLFQQRDSWGSREERLDPATAARLFYNSAIKRDKEDPTRPLWDLCQAVQGSQYPFAYAAHRTEADRIVSAYGVTGGDGETSSDSLNNQDYGAPVDGSNYIFYRGIPKQGGKLWKKEDSWTCIQRLANEVQWRAFFISGVFYYENESELFKQKPIGEFGEFSEGVERLDCDYDIGKKNAVVSLDVRVGTWLVPPGGVIVLDETSGPAKGRWLVSTFSRSLFDSKATITLKKPMPKLPEPLQNDINQVPTWAGTDLQQTTDETVATDVVFAGGFLPLGAKYVSQRLDQGHDIETDAGGPIVAPGDGYVVRIGLDPAGFGTSYPIVQFTTGPYADKDPIYIGHTQSLLGVGKKFLTGQKLSITGTTGSESWNGNASVPGWAEIGYAPGGSPGPWGQEPPFK